MIVPTTLAEPIGAQRLELGESARWDERRQRASWVDIEQGFIYGAALDRLTSPDVLASVDHSIGCAIPTAEGLVFANENRLGYLTDGGLDFSAELFLRDGRRRFNDGCLDPQQRLIVGTLSRGMDTADENLLRIDRSGRVDILRTGVRLSNGVAFHPDGRLFHIDTLARTLSWCDYSMDPQCWTEAFTVEGLPDGLLIDSDGCFWMAIWGNGEVRRYSESGKILEKVVVPTPHVTSCTMVGYSEATMLITTAREGIAPRDLAQHTFAGAIFTAPMRRAPH